MIIPLALSALVGCTMADSLKRNQQAIDCSTYAIMSNRVAIEQANEQIRENTERLRQINESLQEAGS